MSEIQAFELLVNGPALTLDHPVALIAKCARPPVDVGEVLDALDELAAPFHGATFEDVRAGLFVRGPFQGNARDYGDPENSMIDAVIRRKIGIPITLAIVMIEVGRRAGIAIEPVGMPGHFLVRDQASGTLCDPFHGGAIRSIDDCRQMFDGVFRGQRAFHLSDLDTTSLPSVLARVLNNLEQSRLAVQREIMTTLLRLHRSIPLLPSAEYIAIARRFDALGDYSAAGNAAEQAIAALQRESAPAAMLTAAQRVAREYWARSN